MQLVQLVLAIPEAVGAAASLYQQSGQDWLALPATNDAAIDDLGFEQLVGVDTDDSLWGIARFQHGSRRTLVALGDAEWAVYGLSEDSTTFETVEAAGVRGYEVWALTNRHYSYRFNGKSFDRYSTGCEFCVDVSIAGPGEAWLSGAGALRYRDPQ